MLWCWTCPRRLVCILLFCLVIPFPWLAAAQSPPLQRLGLGAGPNGLAVSTRTLHLATCGIRGSSLRDFASGKLLRTFDGNTSTVTSVAVSPDGMQLLSGSLDGTAILWDVATGARIRVFNHMAPVRSVAFSPDGKLMATGGDDSFAKLWDAGTTAPVHLLFPNSGAVNSVVFSPDSSNLLTCQNQTVTFWNTASGAENGTHSVHAGRVSAGAFSPDGGYLVTGGDDSRARVWQIDSWGLVREVQDSDPINSVAFSDDGLRILTGGVTKTAKLWNVASGDLVQTYTGHLEEVTSVLFWSGASQVLTGSRDGNVRLFDLSGGLPVRVFKGHTDETYSAQMLENTKRVVARTKYAARIWEPATGTMIHSLEHNAPLECMSASADELSIVTGNSSEGCRLWDSISGICVQTFGVAAHAVALSPDGTKILIGSDASAQLYTRTGVPLLTVLHLGRVNSVAFSPDGTKFLTASDDATARLWDAISGAPIHTMSHPAPVCSAVFSPDGFKILSICNSPSTPEFAARLWDRVSGGLLHTWPMNGEIHTALFSPDSLTVFVGGDDITCELVSVLNGAVVRTYPLSGVRSAAFSSDGKEILTGDSNAMIRITNVLSAVPAGAFAGHAGDVTSVAFSSNGSKIISASADGSAMTWERNPARAVVIAGGGNFTGNSIAEQTDDLAAYAYRVLRSRGYSADNIAYYSAFGSRDADGDGNNDVIATCTLNQLRETLTGDFATSASRLSVFMIDHGYRTQDYMAFRFSRGELLSTTTLCGWLDGLQAAFPVEVSVVVDSCYSGQFVRDCRRADKRIMISSTSTTAPAVFLPPPDLTSFMYSFLGSAYMGNSLGEAWRAGKAFFGAFPLAGQAPKIDDGTTSTFYADLQFLGASWTHGVQSTQDANSFFPVFDSCTSNTSVTTGTPVQLYAELLPGQNPDSVTAEIRSPVPTVICGDSITSLPHYELTRSSTSPRTWETTVTGVFNEPGDYSISFTAHFPYERLSNAMLGDVTVTNGTDPDSTPIYAVFAVGATTNTQLTTAFHDLAQYGYNVYQDRFQDSTGTHHPESITYLVDSTEPERDAAPSSAAVLNAINTLPSNIGRLFVHVIGDSSTPGMIQMQPGDNLSGADLDAELDALQTRQNCTVVLVVDCAYSGKFLQKCRASGSQQRIVMTGGRSTDDALFMPNPVLASFSQKFLGSAYQGNTLRTGFLSGKMFLNTFLGYQPQLDDTGDGVYNYQDGLLAESLYLGRRFALAGDEASGLPFVMDVSGTPAAARGATVSYNAQLLRGFAPLRVFGNLISADGVATAPLSTVTLTRINPPELYQWETTFTAPMAGGNYRLAVYAEYPDGSGAKLSEPFLAPLHIWTTSPGVADIYESAPYNDSTSATTANVIAPGISQDHTLHALSDNDWMMVSVLGVDGAGTPTSQPFDLRLSNCSIPNGDTIIVDLYVNGLLMPPTSQYISWWNTEPILYVPFVASGFKGLYCHIYSAGTDGSGCAYAVSVCHDAGDNNGLVTQIGANRAGIGWTVGSEGGGSGLSRTRSGTFQGYVVRRAQPSPPDYATGTVTTLTSTPIPVDNQCDCPVSIGAAPGVMCMEYVDTIPVPVPDPGSIPVLYLYYVDRAYSDDSYETHVPATAVFVNFSGSGSGTTFCSGSGVNDWPLY